MPTGERLHRQMYLLMPLQIVVPVERLRTLVALERAVLLRGLQAVVEHVMGPQVVSVALGHGVHAGAAHQRHLPARVGHVGEHRAAHDGRQALVAAVLSSVVVRRRLHGRVVVRAERRYAPRHRPRRRRWLLLV